MQAFIRVPVAGGAWAQPKPQREPLSRNAALNMNASNMDGRANVYGCVLQIRSNDIQTCKQAKPRDSVNIDTDNEHTNKGKGKD